MLLVFAGIAIGSVGFVLAGIGVVWILGAAVMSALSGIYRTALYRYASTGEVPGDFSGIDFQAQFRPRRSSMTPWPPSSRSKPFPSCATRS